jgi:hypothetical protein
MQQERKSVTFFDIFEANRRLVNAGDDDALANQTRKANRKFELIKPSEFMRLVKILFATF